MTEMVSEEQTQEGRTYWEHEFVCEGTGEVVSILVPAGETPPRSVETPKGGTAYKNFGAATFSIPAYMRASSEEGQVHSDAKRMMNHGRKRQW